MKKLKYIIIPYIALGLVLSMPIGITYSCDGSEMFPEYFGSPFVFKRKSLGSSMTYFFSISALLLNVIVWSIPVMGMRLLMLYLIRRAKNDKLGESLYRWLIILLLIFSSLNSAIEFIMIGNGFHEGANYWYMDNERESQKWGNVCEGEWGFFER